MQTTIVVILLLTLHTITHGNTQDPKCNCTCAPNENPSLKPIKSQPINPTKYPTKNPTKNPTKKPTTNPTKTVSSQGCPWTGKMHGPLTSCNCHLPGANGGPTKCTQRPSYTDLGNNLWQCPDGNNPNAQYVCTSTDSNTCIVGAGDFNPICPSIDINSPNPGCCCNLEGCDCTASFNWIIGTCQGTGCGGYSWTPDTQKYKNLGSEVVVNYIASYQYDSLSEEWVLSQDSSFNTDGSKPAFDLVLPYGNLSDHSEAWLAPQPGGAAHWSWGYYPAGVKGVGPPGMMFVLSTQKSWNFAWYMLNQLTLDRGPDIAYPSDKCSVTNNNCWAAGNAGEIDFLESAWTVNAGTADDYRRLFSVQWNQVGRCFVGHRGSSCHADGGWFSDSQCTNNYFLGTNQGETKEYIWVAVVDSVGTFMYRIPGEEAPSIWPGLTSTTAACTLQSSPSKIPTNSGPPCDDSNPYCGLFIPNCQAESWGGSAASNTQGGFNQGCTISGVQGWCNNWWLQFADTNQPLWPANGTKSVVQFQPPIPAVEMPWNREMESTLVDWSNNPIYLDNCCVKGQGWCPSVSEE